MTQLEAANCPDWCYWNHDPIDINDEDPIIHFKGFGTDSNGAQGIVQFWGEYKDGVLIDQGISIVDLELDTVEDLRDVVELCQEVIVWVEEFNGAALSGATCS